MSMTTSTSATVPASGPRRTRVYRRDVPYEWAAALAAVYPTDKPTEAYPMLVWEPGFDYVIEGNDYDEVVERWMIYNMVPITVFDPNDRVHGEWNRGLLAELNGPAPESLRQTIPLPQAPRPNTVRIISGTGIVNQRQWELYRQTGRYGVPIWCVQGSNGGTPMDYPKVFAKRLQLRRLKPEPPLPGELPYADFDGRTLRALALFETVRTREIDLQKNKNTLGVLNQQAAAECVALVDQHIANEIEANADYLVWATKDVDLPVSTVDYTQLADRDAAREGATE